MDWVTFFVTLGASGVLSTGVALYVGRSESGDRKAALALDREKWAATQRSARLEQLRILEDAVRPYLLFVVDACDVQKYVPQNSRDKALELQTLARFAGEDGLTRQLEDLSDLLLGVDAGAVVQRARYGMRELDDIIALASRG
jgi:hypothetical protein